MALTGKTVGLIIVLIVIALSGLVIVQSLLLDYAMELKEQAFRRNVMAALNSAVHRLESDEVISIAMALDSLPVDSGGPRQIMMQVVMFDGDTTTAQEIFSGFPEGTGVRRIWVAGDTMHYNVRTPQRVVLQAYDMLGGENEVLLDTFTLPGQYCLPLDEQMVDGEYAFRFKTDSGGVFVFHSTAGHLGQAVPEQALGEERRLLVQQTVDRLTNFEWEPVEDRIDLATLDSALGESFAAAGIELNYAFGVLTGPTDSVRMVQPAEFAEKLPTTEFRAQLFPRDLFARQNYLAVFFPDRAAFLWWQLVPLLSATAVLMLIIIGCFVYTIRTIIAQKRLAGQMVGFVNNMTHEFKTPISTVALATEAILRPGTVTQQERVLHYNRMIQQENRRMGNQVEKILQMAVLAEGDYQLSLTQVDVHQLLSTAAENFSLQVTQRGGTITSDLAAAAHVLPADSVHLSNVIHNLLDNANKYSPEPPVITISTCNADETLEITITDLGIGISETEQKQVFDQYFRVTRGNVHDVKGFGLGLSYVKLMVRAHGGQVELTSQAGQGTQVKISLPLSND